MSPRPRDANHRIPASRRTVSLAMGIGLAAMLVSVGTLAAVLTRPVGEDPCRSLAWAAIPEPGTLPEGWTVASSRFFVDNATLTLAGPASGTTAPGPAVFVSVSCFGPDARLAISQARKAALAGGAREQPVAGLGDEAFAVTSETLGTVVFLRRGDLVADVTAPSSVEPAPLEGLLYAIDTALVAATEAGPPLLSASDVAIGVAPGSIAPGAAIPTSPAIPTPSPSPEPVSHVAPDLEARLPAGVDGTAVAIDSVTGTAALGDDPTSDALVASLASVGRTPEDLQIARARDPAGVREIRLYAFRLKGGEGTDVLAMVRDALLAQTAGRPVASEVTLGGRTVTRLAYAEGPSEYLVSATDGVVFNVETTDERLAEEVIAALD